MTFQAKLLRKGEIFRRWRNEARIGGMISDVYFRWDGEDYVADAIPPTAIGEILNNNMIVVSLATQPVGEVTVKAEKPAEEEKPVEKEPAAKAKTSPSKK